MELLLQEIPFKGLRTSMLKTILDGRYSMTCSHLRIEDNKLEGITLSLNYLRFFFFNCGTIKCLNKQSFHNNLNYVFVESD